MGIDLYDTYPVYADALDEVFERFDAHLEKPLRDVMFSEPGPPEAVLLHHTAYSQPALFALGVALYRLVESFGVMPDYLIGHSVGELTAAHIAGMLELDDAVELVAARGRLMEATVHGVMVSVEASEDEVRDQLNGRADEVAIAAVNSPSSTVLSGDEPSVLDVATYWRERGRKTTNLKVRHAFHSSLIDPVLAELKATAEGLTFHPARIPLVANLTGAVAGEEMRTAQYWVDQARRTVRFMDGVRTLEAAGVTTFLELGPDPVLTALLLRSSSGVAPVAVSALRHGHEETRSFLTAMAQLHVSGADIEWPKQAFGTPARGVDLPTYRFQRRSYWLTSRRPDIQPSRQLDHPLLGSRVDLAGTSGRWHTHALRAEQPEYLSHHRLDGMPVLPAAAMVEWALASLRTEPDAVDVAWALDGVTFNEFLPLASEDPVTTQTVVEPDGERFRIRCFGSGAVDGWTEYVTASGAPVHVSVPPSTSIDAVRDRLTERSTEDLYRRWSRAGLEYGTAFRGVRTLWCGDGEALASIDTALDLDGYVLHPTLLDSCFQLFAAFDDDSVRPGVLRVPAALDRITVLGSLPSRLWCHAFSRGSQDSGDYVVDLALLSEAGEQLVLVEGLRFRAVSTATRAQLTGPKPRVLETRWRPIAIAAVTPRSGTWRIRSGDPETAERWEAELAGADTERLAGLIIHNASTNVTVEDAYRIAEQNFIAVRDFLGSDGAEEAEIVICSTGAVAPRDEAPEPAQAVSTGMAKALIAEYPDLKIVQVDLDPAEPAPPVAEVLSAAASHSGSGHIAIRDSRWYQAELQEHDIPGESTMTVQRDASYLITGGLGGLGLVVANWLIDRGARTLVLVGRSMTPAASRRVAELTARGARVDIYQTDVADASAVADLLADIRRDLPPLRGVIHAAGTLDDASLTDLTWDRFSRVLDPKIRGAWNLHHHTKEAELDFFVLFSSLISMIGSAGQAAYITGNAFMDALAVRRRREGIPALSVGWGPWAETGMAATRDLLGRFASLGITGLRTAPSLDALARLASGDAPHVGLAAVDWQRHAAATSRRQPYTLLPSDAMQEDIDADDVPLEELTRLVLDEPESAREIILAELLDRVATLLRIPADDCDELRPGFPAMRLSALGLDSLTTVQLRNRLLVDFRADIAPDFLFGRGTVTEIVEAIRQQLAIRSVVADSAWDDAGDTEVLTL